MASDRTLPAIAVALIALSVASPFVPSWVVFIGIVSLAKGLVVLGLLILWRTGLVSFGQSLYYALGAYAVGLAYRHYGLTDAFVAVALAAELAAVVAFVLGFLLAGYRDLFFAMLSLAFAMILYGVLVKSETLGSTDGFAIPVPTFAGLKVGDAGGQGGESGQIMLFVFTATTTFAACFATHRYLASTAGHLTTAIRDNEIRVEYLGYSVKRAIHTKYVITAVLAGIGGALVSMSVGHIDPEMAYWTTAGEFVFVAILSGPASVAAPFIGSILFELTRSYAMQYTPHTWHMVLGAALLLVIMFLPNGLWSLFRTSARAS
jgi:ABC-type branched-subunit amino acid transport system permease subunit